VDIVDLNKDDSIELRSVISMKQKQKNYMVMFIIELKAMVDDFLAERLKFT
jgi:hypothetical protein